MPTAYSVIGKCENENGQLTFVKCESVIDGRRHVSFQTKDHVINSILNGTNTYSVGQTLLRVVNGRTGRYLRTDQNNTEEDNLENVPIVPSPLQQQR